jgi:hypothetical protein
MVIESKEKFTCKLFDNEIKELQELISGYGNLKRNADKAGLKTRTLERIVLTGSGLDQNIKSIREKLLSGNKIKVVSR